jgi:hypothetical protein
MTRTLTLAAAVAGAATLAVTGSAQPLRITSSLDGKTVLPHRIHWLAHPKLAPAKVAKVEFLIDGKVRWTEHGAPYSYSDDGGYLVTSWLSPGKHRFAVRATTKDGQTATDIVAARVIAPPQPPAELAGRWQRDVAGQVPGQHGCGAADPVPGGRWTLVFESRWIASIYPGKFDVHTSPKTSAGFIIDNDWVPGAKTFQVAGSVTVGPVKDTVAQGGWWCEPWGPQATYSWSVAGDTLTLQPVGGTDRNQQRGAIFTGDWTRVR